MARTKQERELDMTQASSSSGMTANDPQRIRRSSQASQDILQNFNRDDFKLDDERRLALRTPVPTIEEVVVVPPQAVAFQVLPDDGISSSALTKLPLSAASSSTGTYITVDTTSDTVKLQGGSAYIVDVHYQFLNKSTHNRDATLAIADTNGTVYATQLQQLQDEASVGPLKHDIWLAAVIDRQGASSVFIEIQALGEDSNVDGHKGWAKAHRLT